MDKKKIQKTKYICKPNLGLIMNCKLLSGLTIITVNFFQNESHTLGSPWPPSAPATPIKTTPRFRKDPNLSYSYTPFSGANPITVKGIIKNVTHRVLPSDSVIVDSILGQGEALDCFNLKLQDNAVLESKLNNDIKQQSIDIINAIPDPTERATKYKKVFGDCCDVPQSGCNCAQPFNPA